MGNKKSILLNLDTLTDDALISIDIAHHMVHDGNFYTITNSDTIDMDAAGRKVWQFTTPNTTKRFHLQIAFYSSNAGTLSFAENPTINAAGTALTAYNNDRNSANATTLAAKYDTTLTTEGTALSTIILGASPQKTLIGGNTRTSAEWILKQNEDYALVFQATNDATVISMVAEFYEV